MKSSPLRGCMRKYYGRLRRFGLPESRSICPHHHLMLTEIDQRITAKFFSGVNGNERALCRAFSFFESPSASDVSGPKPGGMS